MGDDKSIVSSIPIISAETVESFTKLELFSIIHKLQIKITELELTARSLKGTRSERGHQ